MPAAGPSLAQLGYQLVSAAPTPADVAALIEAFTNRRRPPYAADATGFNAGLDAAVAVVTARLAGARPVGAGVGGCPFCGADQMSVNIKKCGDKVHPYRVDCNLCGCGTAFHGDWSAAWKAWNRRAALATMPPTDDALREKNALLQAENVALRIGWWGELRTNGVTQDRAIAAIKEAVERDIGAEAARQSPSIAALGEKSDG